MLDEYMYIYFLIYYNKFFLDNFKFMASAFDDNSLSSEQDTNQFLV